jgi:hypothetical protein
MSLPRDLRRLSVAFMTVSCGLLLLVGCGGMAHAAQRGSINVRVELTTYVANVRHVQSFALACAPTGGNLPLGGRVCRDIRLHPKAMLDPPRTRPSRKTIVCAGGPFMPGLTVTATANGRTRSFGGSPGCTWPGDQAVGVYYDAATNDAHDLSRSESELRCDEDPVLLAVPTPLASVVACRRGLWTPRSEQLIRLAEKTPALTALQASQLFPRDIGALPCTIHPGGPVAGRKLSGLCGVTMKNVWANPTVSFTEDWRNGLGRTARHVWRVLIRGTHVLAISQTGPVPPQLRR